MASPAMGHWGTCPSRLPTISFSSFWSKYDSQLSKYCVVCKISWCRCQQLTALSVSTALVTKLLVIGQLLHPALKSTVSAHDVISSFASPRNKSWRRHCWLCWDVGPALFSKVTFFSLSEVRSVVFCGPQMSQIVLRATKKRSATFFFEKKMSTLLR